MVELGLPDYEKATASESGVKILCALGKMGGEATYDEIKEETGLREDVLEYYLNNEKGGLISNAVEKTESGSWRLKHKTTFCFLCGAGNVPLAYLGLLGLKRDVEPVPKTALQLLREEGGIWSSNISAAYVLTTEKALQEWGDEVRGLGIEFVTCSPDEILNIDAMKLRAVSVLARDEMRNSIVIMDCTGLTKPATIAFYEIARNHYFPLIYVYMKKRRLKWVISRDYIEEKLIKKRKKGLTYEDAVRSVAREKNDRIREDLKRILKFLGEECGAAGVNSIARQLGLIKLSEKGGGTYTRQSNVLDVRLKRLIEQGIIVPVRTKAETPTKSRTSLIVLKYKTPFCWLFGKEVKFAYLGLLGDERPPGRELVVKTALEQLPRESGKIGELLRESGKIGERIAECWVVTTESGYNAWRDELEKLRDELEKLSKAELKIYYYLCPEEKVDDLDEIKNHIDGILHHLLKEYVVIMDCTGLTKPATLALYELAENYCAPLIYIYEGQRKLYWCISEELLMKRIGFQEGADASQVARR